LCWDDKSDHWGKSMKKHLYAICAVTLASPAIALPAKPAIAKTGIVADYNKTPGLCDAMIASRATASGQREWFLHFPPAVESGSACRHEQLWQLPLPQSF
jgi:hypothetical protein